MKSLAPLYLLKGERISATSLQVNLIIVIIRKSALRGCDGSLPKLYPCVLENDPSV
jgi:hypothetical protein